MIVDYKESWPRHFEEVRSCLAEQLGADAGSIEHVGSTAVPGLLGKPIVDIHIAVPDADAMSRIIEKLAVMGYIHEGDKGIPGREAFRRKGPDVPFIDPKRDWYPHHLYASIRGATELERHILFRDHLRSNEADREAYASLKQQLVEEHGHDREAYQAGKDDFINATLAKAGYTGV